MPTCVGALHVQRVGSGPAALLWHSLVVDSEEWARVLPALVRHRALIMIDGPGHGASQPPPSLFTSAQCADAAMTVLDTLGVADADWVGRAGVRGSAWWPPRGTPTGSGPSRCWARST
ncbi:alpha/beta fold hydrolase [Luteimicrobium album]|uniref:alpha/beta fold hydrolase n=1 Tax=Luteimicrobium album TaxID=1054550 RepID=UPI0024E080EA|nr:alpha/beta fold hydrolase [Luteimicrobium album]